MEANNLVLVDQFCSNCDVEFSFINSLHDLGLIQIIVLDNQKYISTEQLKDVERAIHFHFELDINVEGIDVIFNLLKQINVLQEELRIIRHKLNLFELE